MPSISGMAIRHSSAINGALSGAAAASKAAKTNKIIRFEDGDFVKFFYSL